MSTLLIFLIYSMVCLGLAIEASRKGWNFWDNFFIALMLTPIGLVIRLLRSAS